MPSRSFHFHNHYIIVNKFTIKILSKELIIHPNWKSITKLLNPHRSFKTEIKWTVAKLKLKKTDDKILKTVYKNNKRKKLLIDINKMN